MNRPKSFLTDDLVLNYDVVILLDVLSCLLLNYYDLCTNWVELRVYSKTLMVNYEGDLVSLINLILYFKLWLIVMKS